ncbi:unnamed protein product [Gongylonema pulchrum]|uniref:ZM domain-containing protein n=1 Tax=Gongylonema pulchrum TaxID=637853 RepID=A0A183D1E0_9BILA|nr:unnamed protein product [Gongylonema pulchrum]
MAASFYLSFGRRPGQHGNSVYLPTDEEGFSRRGDIPPKSMGLSKDKGEGGMPNDMQPYKYAPHGQAGYPNVSGDAYLVDYPASATARASERDIISGAFSPVTQLTYGQGGDKGNKTEEYIESNYMVAALNNNHNLVAGAREKEAKPRNIEV